MSAAASAYPDEGLIRFEFGTPVHVALKYGEGKLVEGRYGESLLFSTVDGRRFFVPVEVGEQITALGVRAGEAITITKVETRNGRKRGAAYEIGRDTVAAPVSAPASRPMAAASAPGPVPVPPASGDMRMAMYQHYKAAIDILIEAGKYAQAREFPLEFNAEDVRALAATLLIQSKEGGAPWQRR